MNLVVPCTLFALDVIISGPRLPGTALYDKTVIGSIFVTPTAS